MLTTDSITIRGSYRGEPCTVTFVAGAIAKHKGKLRRHWRVDLKVGDRERTEFVHHSARVGRSIAKDMLDAWFKPKITQRKARQKLVKEGLKVVG